MAYATVKLGDSPAQSCHASRIPVHRPRKAQCATLDGDGIIDPTRVSVNDLFSQERPAIDQICLSGRDPSVTGVGRIRLGPILC